MTISAKTCRETGYIDFFGSFDFRVHREFKQAYMALLANPAIHEIQIGMQHLQSLDSAALGMLMLLRERAGECGKRIILCFPSEAVFKVLDVANFDKLFEIRKRGAGWNLLQSWEVAGNASQPAGSV